MDDQIASRGVFREPLQTSVPRWHVVVVHPRRGVQHRLMTESSGWLEISLSQIGASRIEDT